MRDETVDKGIFLLESTNRFSLNRERTSDVSFEFETFVGDENCLDKRS